MNWPFGMASHLEIHVGGFKSNSSDVAQHLGGMDNSRPLRKRSHSPDDSRQVRKRSHSVEKGQLDVVGVVHPSSNGQHVNVVESQMPPMIGTSIHHGVAMTKCEMLVTSFSPKKEARIIDLGDTSDDTCDVPPSLHHQREIRESPIFEDTKQVEMGVEINIMEHLQHDDIIAHDLSVGDEQSSPICSALMRNQILIAHRKLLEQRRLFEHCEASISDSPQTSVQVDCSSSLREDCSKRLLDSYISVSSEYVDSLQSHESLPILMCIASDVASTTMDFSKGHVNDGVVDSSPHPKS